MKTIQQLQDLWVPRAALRGVTLAIVCGFFVLLAVGLLREDTGKISDEENFGEFARMFVEALNQTDSVPVDQFPVTYRLNAPIYADLVLLPPYTPLSDLQAKFGKALGASLHRHVDSNDRLVLVLVQGNAVVRRARLTDIQVNLESEPYHWEQRKGDYAITYGLETRDGVRVIRFAQPADK